MFIYECVLYSVILAGRSQCGQQKKNRISFSYILEEKKTALTCCPFVMRPVYFWSAIYMPPLDFSAGRAAARPLAIWKCCAEDRCGQSGELGHGIDIAAPAFVPRAIPQMFAHFAHLPLLAGGSHCARRRLFGRRGRPL